MAEACKYDYAKVLQRLRYSVMTIPGTKAKTATEVPVIALIDKETRAVVTVTDYADYLAYKRRQDGIAFPRNDAYVHAVAHFLNWVMIENYDTYQITDIREVTLGCVQDYVQSYAETELDNGDFPSRASVEAHRNAVSMFLGSLSHYRELRYIREEDLYVVSPITYKDGRVKMQPEWRIPAKTLNPETGYLRIMRDMPVAIAERFITCAEIYDPELTLAIVLGIFGGLRAGEIVNLCRNGGTLGECFRFTRISGVCTGIEINLLKNRPLRPDGVKLGSIKRKRRQGLYEPFTPYIEEKIREHMELIKTKPCDPTLPLFLAKQKKGDIYPAMTAASYRKRIQNLYWDHVLPSCENDMNTDLAMYYTTMMGGKSSGNKEYEQYKRHSWGAHAFRHLFTVLLVLSLPPGSAYTIQSLRGDRCVESAEIYLRNKGELARLYTKAVDRLIQIISISRKELPK